VNHLKAIFFDLGGTLLHIDYPFFQRRLLPYGIVISKQAFYEAVSKANRILDVYNTQTPAATDATRFAVFYQFFLPELNFPKADIEPFIETVLRPQHAAVNLWNYVFEGTADLLSDLSKKYRIGLISNSDGRAEQKLVQYNLRSFFDFVIDSHVVGVEKPNPRIFQFALDKACLEAKECLYVGDIYSLDVVGAKSAGLDAILIDATKQPRQDCPVIADVFELRKMFL
jgi:HAD superfamily hydrolase (TIGR01509 family)